MTGKDLEDVRIRGQGEYCWSTADAELSHKYLLPAFLDSLQTLTGPVLDLGCGNGALTAALADQTGQQIVGVDGARSGVELARRAHPGADFQLADLTRPLPNFLQDRFPVAISAEVVEHLLLPRELFHRATECGANTFVVSTPYHGYLKNVALAVTGRFDSHWHPLTDYGHIKFFSPSTLRRLGAVCGWRMIELKRLGRVGPLAKSMLAVFER